MTPRILNPAVRLPRRYVQCEPLVKVFSWPDGTNAAFDVNSLCAVSVDKNAAEKLREGSNGFSGLLFSRIRPVFQPPRIGPVRKIVLNLTHRCNLACKYCFASDYMREDDMTQDTAFKALELFNPGTDINVAFFGGEPLLNWPVLTAVAERAHALAQKRGRRCLLHVTTNGTLIDGVKAATLKRLGVSVLVSLDGPEDVHNRTRPAKHGNSYQRTMAGLHHLKEAGHSGRVSVRATFLDARPELVKRLEFFNALYHAGLIASVSIEPAILSEGCGAVPTAKQEREALRREWHEAARWYVAQLREKPGERPVPLFYFRKLIQRIRQYQWMGNECGAGRGYLTIAPNGTLHACHRENLTRIGHLDTGIDEAARKPWAQNSLSTHKECRSCWARYLCGGGCPQARLVLGESMDSPTPSLCATRRDLYRTVIWLLANLSASEAQRIST